MLNVIAEIKHPWNMHKDKADVWNHRTPNGKEKEILDRDS